MTDVLSTISTRKTSQSERADDRQVKNNAGGHSFQITDLERLKRFLILGVDSGSFYVGAKDLAKENAKVVFDMAKNDHKTLVDTIVDVSERGAAPKQQPTLFALAIAVSHGNDDERKYALSFLSRVARTGTHLFTFIGYVENFRGWGRALRRAVGNWYTDKSAESAAFQSVKYRNREGWSHRDVLRLAHAETDDPFMKALFEWITSGKVTDGIPTIVEGFLKAKEDEADIPALIREYGLSWEMLPTEALNEKKTWLALIDQGMPYTALMRNLPRLSTMGILEPLKSESRLKEVVAKLTRGADIRKSRVHPLTILNANSTYAGGYSRLTGKDWPVQSKIVDALDEAFYLAFENVEPTGKRTMLALDVSGSMEFSTIAGTQLTPRDASAALALVQMSVEQEVSVYGFTAGTRDNGYGMWRRQAEMTTLNISPNQRLSDAIREISHLPFGGTDCALPMTHALENDLLVDVFVVYTDSETWAGSIHPHQALKQYREKTGIDAKLIVVGMVSNGFSIAGDDPGSLDIVGFDTGTPSVIAEFSKGF